MRHILSLIWVDYCPLACPKASYGCMEEQFEIPVYYRGEEHCFSARFRLRGYLRQFQVAIAGVEVIFECDEEENYRAVLEASQWEKQPNLDVKLLQAIAQVLESLTRQ